MAGAADISPYDEITSDELFDSFMDVVSGVEQSFNGNEESNKQSHFDENPYEDIGGIHDDISNSINSNLCIEKNPVEEKLSNCIPTNDSRHLPLLVKLTAEPIYEQCGERFNPSLTDYVTNKMLDSDKPFVSDLDKPFIDTNNTENAYTDISSVITSSPLVPSRTREIDRSNNKCNVDGKVSNLNLNLTDIPFDNSNISNYPLYASVSMETRTKTIVTDEYAVVNKEHKSAKTKDEDISDNNKIRTKSLVRDDVRDVVHDVVRDDGTCNNQIEISHLSDDYVCITEAKTIITATIESQDKPIITDIYAVVNKEGSCSDREELHKKSHMHRDKSISSLNSSYNIELSSSLSPTNNNSNNNNNNKNNTNNTTTTTTTSTTTTTNTINNNYDNNNNNKNKIASVNIVSTKHDHAESSPLKGSSHGDISYNNIKDSKDYIDNSLKSKKASITESDYELISDMRPPLDTATTSVSSNNYSNIDDIRNYDTDPHSPELTFNAEQIAYGFRKSQQLANGTAVTQPPTTKATKDKRNFFGFGKWKSTDDSGKSPYHNISVDDLGKESKSKTFSPPSSRPNSSIPVLCSGYLFKQGGTGFTPKNWRLRWFELKKDNCLYYFKSEQDHIPNGAVILVKYQVLRAVEVNKRFAFKLSKSGARTYFFAANSEEEMKKWMTHLGDAAKYAISDHVSIPECSLKNVSIPAISIADPDHHGYISKQGSTHKTWKRRYCVLKYGCLFYYEDMADKIAIGVFKLHKYTINTSDNVRYGFEAAPPVRKMRTYYFYTNTETDTRRWIDAMRRSIYSFQ